jgi:hypothetical protein
MTRPFTDPADFADLSLRPLVRAVHDHLAAAEREFTAQNRVSELGRQVVDA